MTTFKTPLPEKMGETVFISEKQTRIDLVNAVDQLIDCLTELREVVEGKQDRPQLYTCTNTHHNNEPCELCSPEYKPTHQPTPTLKEQLLGEIRRASRIQIGSNDYVNVGSVEAIINRIIK